VIADANRYARQPIELDEPPLGNLLVSGRFHITDSDRFAERIASLFGLAAVHRQGAIHLRKR
jgi:transmembrane sensor